VRRVRRPLLALIALIIALVVGYAVKAADDDSSGPSHPPSSSSRTTRTSEVVALSSLPPQVAATLRLIKAGGPFPYPRNDGVVFHNAEKLLPAEPDGYYREYTVPTPGSSDRGTRRIVTARDGTYYWTADHYDTFQQIDLTR
jgi:guanyl-specific ribonuclease Sa